MPKKEVSSIQELLERYFLRNKDRTIISHKKGYRTYSITGREMKEKIIKTRSFLKDKRIKQGDKIILLGKNSLEWVTIYFSCILSGIVVIPLDTSINKILLKKIQKQVKAKAIFQDKKLESIKVKKYYLDEFDALLDKIKSPKLKINTPKTFIKPNDVLEIIYTSGTTGEPKGVILTNHNILAGINSAVKAVPLKIKLRLLNLLPLSHIFGQVYGLFFMLYFNHHLFFLDSFHQRKIISLIRNKKIHGIILVPSLAAVLKKALQRKSILLNLGPQFHLLGVGGASLDIKLEKWWKCHLVLVLQGYGLTETSSVVSANNVLFPRTGSVGKIAENIDVKLGKDQEILVRGKNITLGYYQAKEKTKEAFEDGWLKTGDIGEIKKKYLYIKERKKDVIITEGAMNVYPIDIKQILDKFPQIKESCVLEKDKKIHAVLMLNKKVDLAELIGKANKKLLPHQQIQNYSIWPDREFPKTPTGKIKKFLVQRKLGKMKLKTYHYEEALYHMLSDLLRPGRKIRSGSKLSELGMDSLKRVEFVSRIEEEFGVEIEESRIDRNTKVVDIDKLIKEHSIYKIKFKRWPLSFLARLKRWSGQRVLAFPLVRIFTKTEYEGLDNLKGIKGPVIFSCNHQSAWDPVPLVRKISQPMAIAGDSEYVFGIGVEGFFKKIYRRMTGFLAALFFNAYPFGGSIGTVNSLEFTGEMLDRGYSILIFPEAHRTPDGKIKKFKSGVGYLALQMKVPVVPVKIEGLFEVLPIGKIIPTFGKSKLKIGKPLMLKDKSYLRATRLIEKKVREL